MTRPIELAAWPAGSVRIHVTQPLVDSFETQMQASHLARSKLLADMEKIIEAEQSKS